MKALEFDYCALTILAILIFSTVFKKLYKGMLNRCFFSILVVSIITTVFDIISVTLDNIGGFVLASYFTHSIYLFFRCLMPGFYLIYITALTDSWMKGKAVILKRTLIILPNALILVLLIINTDTNLLFKITGVVNGYIRCKYFFVLYILTGLVIFYGFIRLFKYHKRIDKMRLYALITCLLFIISAIVGQFVYPHLIIEMFANAVGLLLMMLMVQRPEELTDADTGFLRGKVFRRDLQRACNSKQKKNVIIVKIINYDILREILGFQNNNKLMSVLAEKIGEVDVEIRGKSEMYYLENGVFAVIMNSHSTDAERISLGVHINSTLLNEIKVNEVIISVKACVCDLTCPGNFDDVDMVLSFIQMLNFKDYNGTSRAAREIFNRNKYNMHKEIDTIIENALSERKFMIYYQPIYNTKTKTFTSAEALIRLNDDKYGFISPDFFIPEAEKTGMIHRIGNYVLEEVCQFISSDVFKTLKMKYIEVNLSIVEAMQNNLISKILPIIDQYEVSPEEVNLEVTETAVGNMQDIIRNNIDVLHSNGLEFSLDDFGTGYSNLERIASLPFSLIKIDKKMANSISNDNMRIVVEHMVGMIKELDMKIVVEGVETEEVANYFIKLGCDYIQGYYYAKPMPRDEFIEFIKENNK